MNTFAKIVGLGVAIASFAAGCRVWQHESHLEGIAAEGVPQTRSRYWIRVLPGVSLSSSATWEKCLAIYEERMPSVFSRGGRPVFIELEAGQCTTQGPGTVLLNALLFACTAAILPARQSDVQQQYRVHTSLSERQREVKTFVVGSSRREWEGLLAPLWPMPDVVDRRFVHSGMGDARCRKEYADALGSDHGEAAVCELLNGEADAIVHGVACMLLQFEADQRHANRSRTIGD